MTAVPYQLVAPLGTKATLGMVVLQTDETIEHDFRRLLGSADIAFHVTRIPFSPVLTPELIQQMDENLEASAALLPTAAAFDCVSYACTSGTAHIGRSRVSEHLFKATGTKTATDPMSAAIAAIKALGCRSIGLVSPYIKSVAHPLRNGFEADDVSVPNAVSFGERVESNVARIDPASILSAALEIGHSSDVDAVFLSCTNLRTLDILDRVEAEVKKPVLSSNQCLAWHMLSLSGLKSAPTDLAPGRLLKSFPSPS